MFSLHLQSLNKFLGHMYSWLLHSQLALMWSCAAQNPIVCEKAQISQAQTIITSRNASGINIRANAASSEQHVPAAPS